MSYELQTSVLRSIKHRALIADLNEFGVTWHKEGMCKCMDAFDGEIDSRTYVPCEHLNKAEWKKYKERIEELDRDFSTYWKSKLAAALADSPDE